MDVVYIYIYILDLSVFKKNTIYDVSSQKNKTVMTGNQIEITTILFLAPML